MRNSVLDPQPDPRPLHVEAQTPGWTPAFVLTLLVGFGSAVIPSYDRWGAGRTSLLLALGAVYLLLGLYGLHALSRLGRRTANAVYFILQLTLVRLRPW